MITPSVTSDGSDSKSFEVVITLEPSEAALRAGVSAKAEIQVETITDCLVIPIHAAFVESGKHFAFVVNQTGFEKRELELGKNNVYLVNVVKGLTEGDRVLLFDPRESGAGAESNPGSSGKPDEPSALLSAPGASEN